MLMFPPREAKKITTTTTTTHPSDPSVSRVIWQRRTLPRARTRTSSISISRITRTPPTGAQAAPTEHHQNQSREREQLVHGTSSIYRASHKHLPPAQGRANKTPLESEGTTRPRDPINIAHHTTTSHRRSRQQNTTRTRGNNSPTGPHRYRASHDHLPPAQGRANKTPLESEQSAWHRCALPRSSAPPPERNRGEQ